MRSYDQTLRKELVAPLDHRLLIAPKVPQAAGYRSLQIRATQKVRTKRAQSVSDHIDLPEGVSFRLFFGPMQIFISCPTEFLQPVVLMNVQISEVGDGPPAGTGAGMDVGWRTHGAV